MSAFSCWTDEPGNQAAFSALADLLAVHPGLAVVTWNGRGADLPILTIAAGRCGAEALVEELLGRHVDLFDWQRRNLMLPVMDFGLKELTETIGVIRESGVSSGGKADAMRNRYRRNGDIAIRDQLLDYSREDVDGLVQLTEFLRGLAAGEEQPPLYKIREACRVIDLVYEVPIVSRPDGPRRPPTKEEFARMRAARLSGAPPPRRRPT